MAQYRSYKVDNKSHPKDEITLEIVSIVPEKYGKSYICRASDGDKEVGFTLIERLGYEFISEGEVTENFVRLLARLFNKEFEVKRVVKSVMIDGGAFDDGDGWMTVNAEVWDNRDTPKTVKLFDEQLEKIDELDEEMSKLNLSRAERYSRRRAIMEEYSGKMQIESANADYAAFYLHINPKTCQIGFSQEADTYQLPILRILTEAN